MKKEKIFDKNMHPAYEGAPNAAPETEESVHDEIAEDPHVIHIHDNDYERINEHDEDDEGEENFFERFFGKRPSEDALRKLSIASFVFGVLSCSVFLGNIIMSALGILLSAKCEKHKYRSTFATSGMILSIVGLILCAMLVCASILALILTMLLIATLLLLLVVLFIVFAVVGLILLIVLV